MGIKKLRISLNKKIDVNNLLLVLYCCTLILGILRDSYFPHPGFSGLRLLVFLLMTVISIIGVRHSYYQYTILGLGILVLLFGLFYFPKQQVRYLYIILVFFTMSTISPKKIIFYSTSVLAGCSLLLYLSSTLGIIQNYIIYRGSTVRQSLGTNYPLTFATYIFFMWAGIVFLINPNRLKDKIIIIFLMFLSAFLVYRLTGGRNFSIAICLLSIVLFIKDKEKNLRNWFKIITPLVGMMSILSVFIVKLIPSSTSFYKELNYLFSYRLELQNLLMKYYKPKLFGQFIPQFAADSKHSLFIDNGYIRLIYLAGILFAVLFFIIVSVQIAFWITEDQFKILTIILIILITGIVQGSIISVSQNIFLPLFCTTFKNLSLTKYK